MICRDQRWWSVVRKSGHRDRARQHMSGRQPDWASSRGGSDAGRGFHVQEEVATHLAVDAFLGSKPLDVLIPEGLEDITLEFGGSVTHVQVKSRRSRRGDFTWKELATAIERLATIASSNRDARVVLALERCVQGTSGFGWSTPILGDAALVKAIQTIRPGVSKDVLGRFHLTVEGPSAARDQQLLADRLGIPRAAAVFPYLALRRRIVECADENGERPASRAAQIDRTEIARIVETAHELVDVEALTEAITAGICEIVDFGVPDRPGAFYEGIGVRPGHVAADLLFERPTLQAEVEGGLAMRRTVLIVGPSGAGKSGLLWLTASRMSHQAIWYRLKRLRRDDVPLVERLVRSMDPNPIAQLAFAADDMGRPDFAGWDDLVERMSYKPGVLLLGAIREEDVALRSTAPSTQQVRPVLDAPLAESLFEELSAAGTTRWQGWREPFGLSSGLLLEYVHVLTHGDGLQRTIDQQVERRVREHRDLELSVARLVAAADICDTALTPSQLCGLTGSGAAEIGRALRRLVAEHLVLRSDDGRYAGTHRLRSAALVTSTHRLPPPALRDTLSSLVEVLDSGQLGPFVIRAIDGADPATTAALITALADRVVSSGDAEVLIEATSALKGIAARTVAQEWATKLTAAAVPRWAWAALGASAVVGTPMPFLPDEYAQLATELAVVEARDPRSELFAQMDRDQVDSAIEQLHEPGRLVSLLDALAGIEQSAAPSGLARAASRMSDASIQSIAELMEAAEAVSPTLSDAIGGSLGGLDRLLERANAELPFVQVTVGRTAGSLTVTGDYRAVRHDEDKLEVAVIRLAEFLARLVPRADVVEARAVDASGALASDLLLKRIPRRNLPLKGVVAWNRARMSHLRMLASGAHWTPRLAAELDLLARLPSALSRFLEAWLTGRQADATELVAIANAARELPAAPLRPNDEPFGAMDPTGAVDLLVGIGANVVPRLQRRDAPVPIAAYLHDTLMSKAKGIPTQPEWGLLGSAPTSDCARIGALLGEVVAALWGIGRQFPAAGPPLGSLPGANSIRSAAGASRRRADRRLKERIGYAKAALAAGGYAGQILIRQASDPVANGWPPVEVAAVVQIPDAFAWTTLPEFVRDVLSDLSSSQRHVVIAPTRQGQAVASLAGRLIQNWYPEAHVLDPWIKDGTIEPLDECRGDAFREGVASLVSASGVLACARGDVLHDDEGNALMAYWHRSTESEHSLRRMAETEPHEILGEAVAFLTGLRTRVLDEMAAAKDGHPQANILAAELAASSRGAATGTWGQILLLRLALVELDVDPQAGMDNIRTGLERLGIEV